MKVVARPVELDAYEVSAILAILAPGGIGWAGLPKELREAYRVGSLIPQRDSVLFRDPGTGAVIEAQRDWWLLTGPNTRIACTPGAFKSTYEEIK